MSDNIIQFNQDHSNFFQQDKTIDDHIDAIIEALLLAAERPITSTEISEWLSFEEPKVKRTLRNMQDGFRLEQRGFELIETESGWQFQTNPKHAKYVQKMLDIEPIKLSKASLDTLAIIAYEQPITKSEIDQFRQRDCGAVLKKLLDLSLIHVLGKKQDVGSPLIYGTTQSFLRLFGIRDLIELPRLEDLASLSTDENTHSKTSKESIRQVKRISIVSEETSDEPIGFSDWKTSTSNKYNENPDNENPDNENPDNENPDNENKDSSILDVTPTEKSGWLFDTQIFPKKAMQELKEEASIQISNPKGQHTRFSFQHMFLQTGNRQERDVKTFTEELNDAEAIDELNLVKNDSSKPKPKTDPPIE